MKKRTESQDVQISIRVEVVKLVRVKAHKPLRDYVLTTFDDPSTSSGQLREIHLDLAIIDYQIVSPGFGCR